VSDDLAFLLYALLFRFGIVGAGIYVMFLGYRLLRDEKATEVAGVGERATAEASIPGAKLKIKNVTAGSVFALFGAFLIVAMVLQGNPEKTSQKQMSGQGTTETEKLRGSADDSILATIQSAMDAQSRGATEEAEARFHDVLSKTAPALNGIAWIYVREGKAEKGLTLSRAAVELDTSNAHYLDTLAEAEFNTGDHASALKTIEEAAKLDPSLKRRVDEFRRRALK
jgi:tetratricopeptide (TPR) repeat protein